MFTEIILWELVICSRKSLTSWECFDRSMLSCCSFPVSRKPALPELQVQQVLSFKEVFKIFTFIWLSSDSVHFRFKECLTNLVRLKINIAFFNNQSISVFNVAIPAFLFYFHCSGCLINPMDLLILHTENRFLIFYSMSFFDILY